MALHGQIKISSVVFSLRSPLSSFLPFPFWSSLFCFCPVLDFFFSHIIIIVFTFLKRIGLFHLKVDSCFMAAGVLAGRVRLFQAYHFSCVYPDPAFVNAGIKLSSST